MDTWTLQDAQGELPAVARRALDGHPQVVALGEDEASEVVILARADYRKLAEATGAGAPQPPSGAALLAFFRNSPLAEAVAAGEFDLDALRDRDYGRGVDLE